MVFPPANWRGSWPCRKTLSILARTGLAGGEHHGRSILYRANLECFREVTLFLLKDCCGGRPDICAPLIAYLTPLLRDKGSCP